MLKLLNVDEPEVDTRWLDGFWQGGLVVFFSVELKIGTQKSSEVFFTDFRRRFITLLGYQFRSFHPSTALSMLTNTVPNAEEPPGS